MLRKVSPLFIFILALAGLGLVYQLFTSPGQLLIPVLVLGGIFLAYSIQQRGGRGKSHRKPTARRSESPADSKQRTRKTVPFRVIDGGKDDDNLPKYH